MLLWPQQTDWSRFLAAARLSDDVGLDSLWTWDHLHAIVGDPLQPIFEGWTTLAAWAMETRHIQLGLMVGANTFRNPGLTLKSAVTVDHMSQGRVWLGLGGAWFEYEHTAHGIDFGTGFGQRLDWLDESMAALAALQAGDTVTSTQDGHYAFRSLEHHPLPYRGPGTLPIMIGGVGEKKTLRTVARYATAWNGNGRLELLQRKLEVLKQHCAAVGRDPLDIEITTNRNLVLRDDRAEAERVMVEAMRHNDRSFTPQDGVDFLGSEEEVAAQWRPYLDLGFTGVIVDLPSPFDQETIERLPRLRELVAAG